MPARRQLGKEAFEALWEQGQAMALEQAITEALLIEAEMNQEKGL